MSKFSLLTTIYSADSPDFVRQCFDSIRANTVLPSEIVLVIDGPVPEVLEKVISHLCSVFVVVKCIRLSENHGLGFALSTGLISCSYDFVARIDTDDVAVPERFSKQIEFLLFHPEVDVVGSGADRIDSESRVIGKLTVPSRHDEIKLALWANPMIHPSVMFRRRRILEIGGYDPMLRRRQDYELWFRAIRLGLRFHNLPESLIKYRTVGDRFGRIDSLQAYRQGLIGVREILKGGLPIRYCVIVFYPFIRSLFPVFLQRFLHICLRRFDPRLKR